MGRLWVISKAVLPENFEFSVFGQNYQYREKIYIALRKPQGFECSHHPQHHQSVLAYCLKP